METENHVIRDGEYFEYRGAETTVVIPEGVRVVSHRAFFASPVRRVILPHGLRVIKDMAFAESELESVVLPDTVEILGHGVFRGCERLLRIDFGIAEPTLGRSVLKNCPALESIAASETFLQKMHRHRREWFGEEDALEVYLRFSARDGGWGEVLRREARQSVDTLLRHARADLLPAFLSLWERVPLRLLDAFVARAEECGEGECLTQLLDYHARHYPPTVLRALEEERMEKAMGLRPMTEEDWREIFRYRIHHDGTVQILEYLGADFVVYLPREIGGYPVAHVDADAFFVRHRAPLSQLGGSPRKGRREIGGIVVDEDHEYFSVLDGNLYTKQKKTLLYYVGGSGERSFTIPEGVEGIAYQAFAYCPLESVTLPAGMKQISALAFSYCEGLRSIRLPESLEGIGDGAFFGCTALKDIPLPAHLSRIGRDAFFECTSLTSLQIPDSVQKLGICALRECTSLTHVRVGEGIEVLEEATFMDCTALSSVTLSRGIRYVSGNAFKGCHSALTIRYEGTPEEWERVERENPNRPPVTW